MFANYNLLFKISVHQNTKNMGYYSIMITNYY